MIKTKIAYEDIKAGDLLEVVGNYAGVKSVHTGIAFESDTTEDEEMVWMTSEGGNIVMQWDRDTIYRIDVKEATFDDIREGDLLEVTAEIGDRTERVLRGKAYRFIEAGGWYDGWATEDGIRICTRENNSVTGKDQKIVILERGA